MDSNRHFPLFLRSLLLRANVAKGVLLITCESRPRATVAPPNAAQLATNLDMLVSVISLLHEQLIIELHYPHFCLCTRLASRTYTTSATTSGLGFGIVYHYDH